MADMLNLYRRHVTNCPHRHLKRSYTRCSCPVWVDGFLSGNPKRIHRTLETRSWRTAERIIAAWENGEEEPVKIERPSIAQATEAFLADCQSRRLSAATIRKYSLLCRRLIAFAQAQGLERIMELDVPQLRQFRETWELSPSTAAKELERLRALMEFCCTAGWLKRNPARKIKGPRVNAPPTLPYTVDDIHRIIAAIDKLKATSALMKERCRVLVWTLRYTGLRISDAAHLHASQIDAAGRLRIRQGKTGTPVLLPLPGWLVQRLENVRYENGHYFKGARTTRTETDTSAWRRRFARIAKHAGMDSIRFHRFRDSFSVGLLEAGIPIETVAELLGHSSIKTTQKHYAPWVQARQVRLEEAVRRAFSATPLLHEEIERRK